MANNHPDPHRCMSKLNEHCQKKGLKLEYKNIDITGPSHDRVFTVAVVIDKVQYESAIGKTKKQAKAQAAVLAWNTIEKQKKGEPDSCEQHKESTLSPLSLSVPECTSSNSINYVSLLNEYALKNKVHVRYNLVSKTGLEHKPIFSYECWIGDIVFDVGRGNKAQVAKFEAAKLAYEKLTSSSTFRVSPPSQSMKPKRKETQLETRKSEFTKNDRFLEDFRDIVFIACGGFGNVFKAKHWKDLRLCVIKRTRLLGKKDNGEKAEREVQVLAKLEHPHIIRYFSCWTGKDIFQSPETGVNSSEQHDCLFIHMEFCEKGDLSDWIEKREKDSCKEDSIILFQQIVEGVEYIHSMDLIHRDLKPLNVFFHSEKHIKIGDFGLVTDVNVDVGQRTVATGTPSYRAPEQEGTDYGEKVDIFPLGLILYEMLFPFFTYAEKSQEWSKIKEGKFPTTFTKKFSEETSLIKKLLSKEPTQRPSAADILNILKGQPHRVHTY